MLDHYKLKNEYSNLKERVSFHLEVLKCKSEKMVKGEDGTVENYCKEDDEIVRVLNEIYFTLYV